MVAEDILHLSLLSKQLSTTLRSNDYQDIDNYSCDTSDLGVSCSGGLSRGASLKKTSEDEFAHLADSHFSICLAHVQLSARS